MSSRHAGDDQQHGDDMGADPLEQGRGRPVERLAHDPAVMREPARVEGLRTRRAIGPEPGGLGGEGEQQPGQKADPAGAKRLDRRQEGLQDQRRAGDEQRHGDQVGDLAEGEAEPFVGGRTRPGRRPSRARGRGPGRSRLRSARARRRRGGAARSSAGHRAAPRGGLAPFRRRSPLPRRPPARSSGTALLPHEHAQPIRRPGRQPCASARARARAHKLTLKVALRGPDRG